MHPQIYAEADHPRHSADNEHTHAELAAFLWGTLSLCGSFPVVVEDLVRQDPYSQCGKIAHKIHDEFFNGEDVGEDVGRKDIAENLLIDNAAHGCAHAEEQERQEEHWDEACALY